MSDKTITVWKRKPDDVKAKRPGQVDKTIDKTQLAGKTKIKRTKRAYTRKTKTRAA